MKSYLLSALVGRHRTASLDEFKKNFAHDWVVWEPGAWRPPGRGPNTTMVAAGATPPPRAGAESLAMVLEPGSKPHVSLGRTDQNELVVSDATLSQTHLVFMKAPSGWTVRDAGSSNGSWLDDQKMEPGVPHPLKSGARLKAGQVHFTYYSPEGMYFRLKGM